MPDVQVTFTKAPAAARVFVGIYENGAIKYRLAFGDTTETRTLTIGVPYSIRWRLLGSEGDSVTVNWTASDGQSGVLINDFTIDRAHPDCVPYPGGPFADYGSNILQL